MLKVNSSTKTTVETNLSSSTVPTWAYAIKVPATSITIDQVLDISSKHAVSNSAVTTAINEILEKIQEINSKDELKIVNCEKSKLPTIGESNVLYVSKKDNAFYIWNEESLCYKDFGQYDIELINGGNSTNGYEEN